MKTWLLLLLAYNGESTPQTTEVLLKFEDLKICLDIAQGLERENGVAMGCILEDEFRSSIIRPLR